MRLHKKKVFVHLGNVATPDVLVIIADFFMRINSVTWSIVSGALPTGLTLSSNGQISGTPTVVGSFQLTFQANDGLQSTDQQITLEITGNLSATRGSRHDR